ncbi:NADPH-dependent FMN reductase [Estrella lausannensis]|uniref:NADPH:quinone oxidoreductase n=1 Tax=Estrella lausannensis TaxID=483423 RepID=A0A0H5DP49_9BACT|nr:NAD(P)H-dependent oxidoreductase [Estrella lausannensis]CRX38266.1 NADPH:quinone oxidoreductase [Estrella lausannensis]
MLKYLLYTFVFFSLPLAAETRVVVFSGSLRADSWNTKLAKEAAYIASKKGATVTYFDLNQYPLPFFNEDIERTTGMPENAKTIRRAIQNAHAVIIASPNYNGSMSGVLKNLLDWISRSEDGKDSRSVFKGKKVALMSASTGKSGGSGGLAHLQYVIEKMNGSVIERKISVGRADSQFDADGHLIPSETRSNLAKEIEEAIR